MAERERRTTPPYGGVFVPRTRVMDAEDMRRALWRMAHEISERNHGLDDVAIVGLQTGGVELARLLAANLEEIDAELPAVGLLDVALHRDDIGVRPVLPEAVTLAIEFPAVPNKRAWLGSATGADNCGSEAVASVDRSNATSAVGRPTA